MTVIVNHATLGVHSSQILVEIYNIGICSNVQIEFENIFFWNFAPDRVFSLYKTQTLFSLSLSEFIFILSLSFPFHIFLSFSLSLSLFLCNFFSLMRSIVLWSGKVVLIRPQISSSPNVKMTTKGHILKLNFSFVKCAIADNLWGQFLITVFNVAISQGSSFVLLVFSTSRLLSSLLVGETSWGRGS